MHRICAKRGVSRCPAFRPSGFSGICSVQRQIEIRAAFTQWTEDFNAARGEKVCDLFAKDLMSDYRGVPERGYERQCQILQAAFADGAAAIITHS